MSAASTTDKPPALWCTASGQSVLLRPVHHDDASLLESFFNRLSPQSRTRRFHIGVGSLPPSWLQWMTHPDAQHESVWLAIAFEGGQPVCIGEARYALGEGPPGEREFAVAIADGWQGLGLGRRLLAQLGHDAEQMGITRLVGDVMRDNMPMIELARRSGYAVGAHPSDARLLQVSRLLGAAGHIDKAGAARRHPPLSAMPNVAPAMR